jgi:hypothetical protein
VLLFASVRAARLAEGLVAMIEVVLNDRLGKKFRVKCKCVVGPRVADWVV